MGCVLVDHEKPFAGLTQNIGISELPKDLWPLLCQRTSRCLPIPLKGGTSGLPGIFRCRFSHIKSGWKLTSLKPFLGLKPLPGIQSIPGYMILLPQGALDGGNQPLIKRPLLTEPNFLFRGMNIQIHQRGGHCNKYYGLGIATLHEPLAITFDNCPGKAAVPYISPVCIDKDFIPSASTHFRGGQIGLDSDLCTFIADLFHGGRHFTAQQG